jgi:hypothetical protein
MTVLPKIPDWTAEQYLTTTAPFDWLYATRADTFVMLQLRSMMKEKAGMLGVKNFIELWKAYLSVRENKYKEVTMYDNVTEFTDQPLELYCGEYSCNDEGIKSIGQDGSVTVVCRHPIMPVRRLKNLDTGEIKLELAYRRGARWTDGIVVDRPILANCQKIIDLAKYGIAVDSDNSKDMVKYITCVEDKNYDKLGETKSVARLGWIRGCGFSPYVDGVVYDGDAMLNQAYKAVHECGDYNTWIETARKIRQHGIIAHIMMAASFSSVLVEPLGLLPFFLHIWGGTEAGKTVGLMVAASVWADPDMGEYIRTFNSTSVAQEVMAGFCNSLPICMDELQIIKDRADFDKTIYMLTEGIGRGRGAKSGGMQKTYTWRNCIITTGEMPISNPNSGGGAVNRIIEIDCKDEKLFDDPRMTANTVRQNYGFAGREFVRMLTDNIPHAKEIYQSYYSGLVSGSSTEKQSMAASVILTADQLATEWIFKDGRALKSEDLEEFLTTKDEVDSNRRALDWLYGEVAVNSARFDSGPNSGEVWGQIDDDYIYIIKGVFDRIMQDAGYNGGAFLSWAKGRNLLKMEDGHTTCKKRVAGVGSPYPVRCVAIMQNAQQDAENYVQYEQQPF